MIICDHRKEGMIMKQMISQVTTIEKKWKEGLEQHECWLF